MAPITLFGPQRLRPILAPAFDRLAIEGPVAVITAGWQEREGENEELAEHLGRSLVDLRLHARAEEVFAADRELFDAYRERQNRLREMQRIYRYRLDYAIEPTRELLRRTDDPELVAPHRESALGALRRLDAEHLAQIRALHRRFDRRERPLRRRAVMAQRREIGRILERCDAVAIAGGHVAVLLNRLRLFGLARPLAEKPVFAWSAGAMALGERVVAFHDNPPWGGGSSEVLEVGLGLYRGLVALPDARHRLRLVDHARVALLARRFAPALCVPLDEGDSIVWDGERWQPTELTRRLTVEGRVEPMETA